MTLIQTAISTIQNKQDLTITTAEEVLTEIFSENVPQEDITQLLSALYHKGESVTEIIGFAKAMRAAMIKVDLPKPIIDNCGTGGTGKSRFNVSTASSIVLGSMGIPVAKHGNRGSKAPNGSIDFVEALGIPIDLTPAQIQTYFNKNNLCFLFARAHHSKMKAVLESRKQLPHRTIFNLLGPLCNPASVTHQLIGTPSLEIAKKLAEAIQSLGTQSTWIVVGGNDTDELSPTHISQLFKITPAGITQDIFNPKDIGITADDTQLTGSTSQENAKKFIDLIQNRQIENPIIQHIALNVAAAISVFNGTPIKIAYNDCLQHIQEGRVDLEGLRRN